MILVDTKKMIKLDLQNKDVAKIMGIITGSIDGEKCGVLLQNQKAEQEILLPKEIDMAEFINYVLATKEVIELTTGEPVKIKPIFAKENKDGK